MNGYVSSDSFQQRLYEAKLRKAAEDKEKTKQSTSDTAYEENDQPSVLEKGVTLKHGLRATFQHYDRRHIDSYGGLGQELLGPFASYMAYLHDPDPNMIMTSLSAAFAAFSIGVCARESLFIIPRHKQRVHDASEVYIKTRDPRAAEKVLRFEMVHVKEHDEEDEPLKLDKDGMPTAHYIKPGKKFSKIVDEYDPQAIKGQRVTPLFIFKEAAKGVVNFVRKNPKWRADVVGGEKSTLGIIALTQYSAEKRIVRKSRELYSEFKRKAEYLRYGMLPQRPYIEPIIVDSDEEARRIIKNYCDLNDRHTELRAEMRSDCKEALVASAAANSDLGFASLELVNGVMSLANLQPMKATSHFSAAALSTDAPRFLLRRVSDLYNNLSSNLAEWARGSVDIRTLYNPEKVIKGKELLHIDLA